MNIIPDLLRTVTLVLINTQLREDWDTLKTINRLIKTQQKSE